jgi:hypothetical protein
MAKATAAAFPESIRPLRCFVLTHNKALTIESTPLGLLAEDHLSYTKSIPEKSYDLGDAFSIDEIVGQGPLGDFIASCVRSIFNPVNLS